MVNILIIINSLQFGGGAEKVATMVGDALSDTWEYTVRYLTFYDAEKKYPHTGEAICLNEILSGNIVIRIYKLLYRAYKIKQVCKKYNIHYAFSHLEEANFSNMLSKILFFNPSKIYLQIHGSVNMWGKWYRFFIKTFYKRADRVITLVREEEENLANHYDIPTSRLVTIHNPIDIGKIQELQTEDLWEYSHLFSNSKFTFINIGRFVVEKNQVLLIEAFKQFYKKYPESQLIILGEWELRKTLESKIIGYTHCIHLLGNQKNPYKFLANSDCFISTSKSEWLPWAMLESLSVWLPIISTDCRTGPKEILQRNISDFSEKKDVYIADYGILVPRFDIQKIIIAMERISQDVNLYNQYKKKSLVRARDFDINSIISQWKQLFW